VAGTFTANSFKLMSNVQQEPNPGTTEFERGRRERFKAVVFAVLITSALMLIAVLIYRARFSASAISAEATGNPGPGLTNAASVPNDP
jgi:hypothetical protein